MSATIEEFANEAAALAHDTPTRLSVLIPFYRDDPSQLLSALAHHAPSGVELITLDDGAPEPALTSKVERVINALKIPAHFYVARPNLGRSAARNAMASKAKGDWLLFLDADMAIRDGFLLHWLQAISASEYKALFGGYEPVSPTNPSEYLHAELARRSDVMSAQERAQEGPVTVCSSNLCVKADAFSQTPFPTQFNGWGWEDTCWALSFAQNDPIGHVDIPAGHAGLESVERLIAKFGQSGPNFARLLQLHPDYQHRKGAKLALRLKAWGLDGLARGIGVGLARFSILPIAWRVLGLKLFRAGISARHLS